MSKRYKVFKWTTIFLFVTFITLYFSQLTGYYEYQNYQRMVMTKEQIEQFEQDVKDGKAVDIKDYVKGSTRNYKNNFSQTGSNLSSGISNAVKNTVIKLFHMISGYIKE